MTLFYILILFIIVQRLVELYIARKNEQWMKARGGIEVGRDHYKWFLILQLLFFVSLLVEFHVKLIEQTGELPVYATFLFLFVLAQFGRFWCILSLGRFWNTKIIVLPKITIIKKGPYKYVKHPNYIIVFIELLSIPLLFGLYITALIFPFLYLLLLTIRVPSEEATLNRASSMK
ncbi:MAG TPA: isoprenylcysteine carboxylmethyltransferase family protein [Pseudogracilibacillus sp.]|nr:isoprenylcysteine carboxylmethyltransferase family protein [Pseudogracilibacillus sp.]